MPDSLLDAISIAVDTADGNPTPEPQKTEASDDSQNGANTDATGDDRTAGSSDTDGEVSGTEGAPDGQGTDGESGAAEGGEGDQGAEDKKAGQDDKKSAEGASGEAASKSASGEVDSVKKAAADKLNAAVNDPIDQRLKESTRDRIQLLANTVKERDTQIAQRDQALAQANTLFDAIDDTGMNPDELATMLGYARVRHHGTAEEKKKAYAFLKDELRSLALEVGETDVVDFTTEHQDLQDAVTNNQITPELAREIAISRSRAKRDTEAATAMSAHATAQQTHAAGVKALGDIAQKLASRDGDAVFTAKKAVITAALKPVLAQLDPSKWALAFQQAYENVKLPRPAAAAPVRQSPQPLRPGTPAGGGNGGTPRKEAKTLFDAVSAAVDGGDD